MWKRFMPWFAVGSVTMALVLMQLSCPPIRPARRGGPGSQGAKEPGGQPRLT